MARCMLTYFLWKTRLILTMSDYAKMMPSPAMAGMVR
jgi:hypothetical protein